MLTPSISRSTVAELNRRAAARVAFTALSCLVPLLAYGQKTRTPNSAATSEIQLRTRLQFAPHDAEAHKQLIELLQKKYAFRAVTIEDAAWVKNNPDNCLLELTDLVSYSTVALQDPEFAIAHLHSYLADTSRQNDPEDYDGFSDRLASLLIDRGRPQEALPLLADLVRLNPDEAGFWADYAFALSALGRYQEAVGALQHSIALDPSMEYAHEDLADVLLRSGDLKGAETEYRATISVYVAQYKTGQPTDSLHSLMRSMTKAEAEHHEESVLAEMHLKLARVLLLEKKYDDAIAETQAALDANKYEFVALYFRAQIYDAQGDHEQATKAREMAGSAIEKEAASEFSKTPKNKPDVDPRILFLSDTLWNGKSGYPAFPSEIVSILEPRITKLSAYDRIMLATAYFALSRVPEAKQQWEKAIATDPATDNAAGQANLGRELLKVGADKDALPHLQRAYELDPQNVTYRMDYEQTRGKLRE